MKSGPRWVTAPGVRLCMRAHSHRPARPHGPRLWSATLATSVPDLPRSGDPGATPRRITDCYAERTDVFYKLASQESLSLQEGGTEERSSHTLQISFLLIPLQHTGELNQETDITTQCLLFFL